ncbi:MAG: hydantoinase/oxoprolinase family protein [Gammaproteobacteria bacterium]|nr:hydantoinase/oxoprolinase family protein [Gammaproteobacteria bacterium]
MRYLSADVGGTFTDLVLVDTDGQSVHLDKVPSGARGSAEAVPNGIKRITAQAGIAAADIDLFVHGFTIATNAFLTRRGSRVVLVVTQGFRDVLEIANQLRPHLYLLTQTKPAPVVPRSQIVEVLERLDAFGNVVVPLAKSEVSRVAEEVAALKPESVAVCLTFSQLHADHERMIAEAICRRLPQVTVYCSVDVNPQIEEYPRTNTTAIAAYVGPVVDRYVTKLGNELAKLGMRAPLRLMRSDGGVATPQSGRENPAHMLLSGPAGGVIAGASLARDLELADLVTFDMGGTSADFSLVANAEPRLVTSRVIDGQPLRLPSLDIETISSGGGSIARVDVGGGLKVGPDSAGAIPGPACYGSGGGDATITDAAVILGLLHPADYLGGEMQLDDALARQAIAQHVAEPMGLSIEEAAFGVVTVANAQMIQAIRTLSVERGYDVRRFALLAFGGAGPLYASYLARDLGMAEVVVPRNPGVFAAHGLLMSDIRHTAQAPYPVIFDRADASDIEDALRRLSDELDHALTRDGVAVDDRYFRYSGDLRCVGQFHELQVPLPAPAGADWWHAEIVADRFHDAHEAAYGHADRSVPVEVVNLRVEAFGYVPKAVQPELDEYIEGTPEPHAVRLVYLDRENGFRDCAVYRREDLRAGHRLPGPAIVTQRDSTVLILADQEGQVIRQGIIRIAVGGNKL